MPLSEDIVSPSQLPNPEQLIPIFLNLQTKALRKSYLWHSHGDALVEERTNPSCSLTPVNASAASHLQMQGNHQQMEPTRQRPTRALDAAYQPQWLTVRLHFISSTRRRAQGPRLCVTEISPYKGAGKAMLKAFEK